MVEVVDVSYVAGGNLILDGVTARFRRGRFNVILGPNGAGKSSLLKIATGLLQPSNGTVTYDGKSVGGFAPVELARRRAVLSQHVELTFPLPVRDVVLMGRYPHYGRSPAARDVEIVERALEIVGMQDRREQLYPTLSGGEQQKVQLARVLAQIWTYDGTSDHKYLFLDEPTASLDVHYQIHLLDVARELLAHECTIVAILHDLNVAFHYGDAFFLMDGGRMAREADSSRDLPPALIEQVFRVTAHRLSDPESGEDFWRFTI
ncbi:MAG TPA: ATP-binding cassette domain-containing protein [Gemmatimonadaceae bacterium]|jgi:iron complex transport system ATP-binding protein